MNTQSHYSIKYSTRAFPINNYNVFYSVDEGQHVVNISRVLYGRRNIDSLP